MTTVKITTRNELMESLYSKETENINACILEGKEEFYEKRRIEIPFDKTLIGEKQYSRDHLTDIADIYENYGWRVEVYESDRKFYFS